MFRGMGLGLALWGLGFASGIAFARGSLDFVELVFASLFGVAFAGWVVGSSLTFVEDALRLSRGEADDLRARLRTAPCDDRSRAGEPAKEDTCSPTT
jgi:hypothetical protein